MHTLLERDDWGRVHCLDRLFRGFGSSTVHALLQRGNWGGRVCFLFFSRERARARGTKRVLNTFRETVVEIMLRSCRDHVEITSPSLTRLYTWWASKTCSEINVWTEENMRFRVPFLTPFQQKLSQESCSELGVDWSRFSTDFQQFFNSFSTVFQQFFDRNC